jgi:hypothetical protein
MQLDRDGAQLFPGAFTRSQVAALVDRFSMPADRPGVRLGPTSGLAALLAPADAIARDRLGPGARAVGAKLFDKSRERNWALGWHQDRTVAVRERCDVAGFGQWTHKAGIAHCVPPFEILERSLTLRIHLDPVGGDNAPLLVAPGSHRLGAIAKPDIAAVVDRCGVRACLARPGDVWIYSTPILHASSRAGRPLRRRVLQLVYSAEELAHGLEWLGVSC